MAGTAVSEVRAAPADAREVSIVAPTDGSILVLDPDIPPAHQRVFPQMSPPRHDLVWQLDGETLAAGSAWAPRAGRHELKLVDRKGSTIDSAQFVVRGQDRLSSAVDE